MKFSQAVREGSRGMQQLFDSARYYHTEPINNKIIACDALYAAYRSGTNDYTNASNLTVARELRKLGWWNSVRVKHPLENHEEEIWLIVIDLNDTHHWHFLQIADWLESIGR